MALPYMLYIHLTHSGMFLFQETIDDVTVSLEGTTSTSSSDVGTVVTSVVVVVGVVALLLAVVAIIVLAIFYRKSICPCKVTVVLSLYYYY